MFHTVRLFSGLAGMCIVGFIFWMFVIAFVDFNTSEFRNLVPSANYLSTSYSEKVNSVMKTPKEFLRIALENAIHTDRSEPATTVNSTSGKYIDISPFQFMDYYSQLASMSGWVANGTGLTVSEMFYVMNFGDPSHLNFTKSITAPYSVAMWTQNRLAFRADLRTLRAKGFLDPNETMIVPSKNPPPYVTVDLPVDMDVPSWMMAVGSLFANAKSRDAIPVLLTIKAHAAAQHFENITMQKVSYSTLTSNKGEVIEIIPRMCRTKTPNYVSLRTNGKWMNLRDGASGRY
ncbi:uncharacterized protein LOC129587835 [Paramacrobiotus metropolitanus]|uniref:uncharacterized protein LOC129587835 n=1 Tax=Paramacrobiotus metropolitanus TaxID=2943436 RepID=UPI0024457AC4|nr:uncharacterized protein LOC129587835 [Paramacrobiotus metropolitanus]